MTKRGDNVGFVEKVVNKLAFNDSTKGKSLFDDLESRQDEMFQKGTKSKPMTQVKDTYNQSLTGAGNFDVARSFTNYGLSNDTLNWALWLALYNDSWVFRRAIDKPAQDEVNCGFTINGDKDYTKVYKSFNAHKDDMIQLLMWGALFGGSVAVILFDGISDEQLSKPLKKSEIKGRNFKLYVTDRWYGVGVTTTETVSNMKDIDFGKPKFYSITFADGRSCEVHHSWVLRYENRTAPKLIKNGQLQGWGYAEGAHILNELARDDQLKAAIQTLVNKSLIEVIKMAGMRGVFMGQDKGNAEQLQKRLEMVNWGRSYNSLTFLDKEDDYQQNTFGGLNGLAQILEQNMWLISAALEMQGVLYGDLRGGFSQAADDMKRYAVTIKNRCDTYYRPVLKKFLKILFIVHDIGGTLDFKFNSIIQSEENKETVEAIGTYFDTLSKLQDKGIISKYQIAKSLKDYMEKDVISIQFTEAQLNRLKFEEEAEILEAYKKFNKKEQPAEPTSEDFGTDIGEEDFTEDLSEELESGGEESGNDQE